MADGGNVVRVVLFVGIVWISSMAFAKERKVRHFKSPFMSHAFAKFVVESETRSCSLILVERNYFR